MKGNVIGFDPDTNTGAISGHDGLRYDFATIDWHGNRRPRHGDVVDFTANGARATQIYMVEEAYAAPSLGVFLLSPGGRISRSQYWLKWLLPVTAIVVAVILSIFAISDDPLVIATTMPIIDLILLWPTLAILIKRSHDRDRSGWFILLLIVPLLNLWPAIELLFLRGTIGSNRFGPDPVPQN